ncbi:ARMT1-like domain-containing protein [Desulfobacula sp.]
MKHKAIPLVRVGENPDFDAWFTAFFLKNTIDPFAYPTKVGSKEQIEFMVYPEDGERYFPCSDKMFEVIMSREYPPFLKNRYQQAFDKIMAMIDELIDIEYDNRFLKALIKIKYDDEIHTGLLIPSRLEKKMYKIFLSRTHIENPYSADKQCVNKKIKKFITSENMGKALNQIDDILLPIENLSLIGLREKIKEIEFQRRLTLITQEKLWTQKKSKFPSLNQIKKIFKTPILGDGLLPLLALVKKSKQKILWLADESGEVILDLAIVKFLAELGHIVIFAVKEEPFFKKVCLADTRTDPVLVNELENAHFIYEKTISKNSLVKLLKYDKNIYVVSDGTRENINLLLTTTTFSRIFKEMDCVISRGKIQKKRLIDSHFRFTQNIINLCLDKNKLMITYKPRHPDFIKFSHQDLEEKANKIINQMKSAKKRGMTVMFYSGIIGSIPGKIDIAKKIMSTFINYLHKQSSDLFIINPSFYYELGMDADDLMYMWEIVQRSTYIDIWRFQTSTDIAQSFSLLTQKVPPEWIGKDATYSTGCTKEMRIAVEVQKENPEMQLIGPSIDKFMRRNEYGIGSMYDQRLADS